MRQNELSCSDVSYKINCVYKVAISKTLAEYLGWLQSKRAYKVGFLLDKWVPLNGLWCIVNITAFVDSPK